MLRCRLISSSLALGLLAVLGTAGPSAGQVPVVLSAADTNRTVWEAKAVASLGQAQDGSASQLVELALANKLRETAPGLDYTQRQRVLNAVRERLRQQAPALTNPFDPANALEAANRAVINLIAYSAEAPQDASLIGDAAQAVWRDLRSYTRLPSSLDLSQALMMEVSAADPSAFQRDAFQPEITGFESYVSAQVAAVYEAAAANPNIRKEVDLRFAGAIGASVSDTAGDILAEDAALNAALGPYLKDGKLEVRLTDLKDLFRRSMGDVRGLIRNGTEIYKKAKALGKDVADLFKEQEPGFEGKLQTATKVVALVSTAIKVFGNEKLAKQIAEYGGAAIKVAGAVAKFVGPAAKLGVSLFTGNYLGAAMSIASVFGGGADDAVKQEVSALRQELADFRNEVRERFDKIDRELEVINGKLDDALHRLVDLQADVKEIKGQLAYLQAEFLRLSDDMQRYASDAITQPFRKAAHDYLGYSDSHGGGTLSKEGYDGAFNAFHFFATDTALSSTETGEIDARRPLTFSIGYLKDWPVSQGLPPLSGLLLPNLRDWSLGCEAMVQLALENPQHSQASKGWMAQALTFGRRAEAAVRAVTVVDTPGGPRANYALFDRLFLLYRARLGALLDRVAELGKKQTSGTDWDRYAAIADALSREKDSGPARGLTEARELLVGYISLGLSRSLQSSDELRLDLYGDRALPGAEEVIGLYLNSAGHKRHFDLRDSVLARLEALEDFIYARLFEIELGARCHGAQGHPESVPMVETAVRRLSAYLGEASAPVASTEGCADQVQLPPHRFSGWRTVPSLPSHARARMATAVAKDGRIYLFGGLARNYTDESGKTGQQALPFVEAYDPLSMAWDRLPDMPYPLYNAAAVTGPKGIVYVLGGSISSGEVDRRVQSYDPATGAWSFRDEMPAAREGLGAALGADGLIYAIGGDNGKVSASGTWAYDPVTGGNWSTLSPLQRERSILAVVAAPDGRIYAVGGTAGGRSLGAAEVRDPTTGRWSYLPDLVTGRYGAALALGPGGILYVAGGASTGPGFSATALPTEVLAPSASAWTPTDPIPSPRWWAGTATLDGRLYVLGGYTGKDDPQDTASCESYVMPSAAVALSRRRVVFSDQPLGTEVTQVVTLVNRGDLPLHVTQASLTGPGTGDFSLAQPLPITLAPGSGVSLRIRFAPRDSGRRAATLSLLHDGAGGEDVLQLVGYTTPPPPKPEPMAVLNSARLDLGGVPVGSASAPATVTLSNGGDAPLDVLAVLLAGDNPGDFRLNTPFTPRTLMPGDSMPLSIAFAPIVPGDRQARLEIVDSGPGSPQTVMLVGTGTALGPPSPGIARRVASDFDGDGKSDILWRQDGTGADALWQMEGLALRTASTLPGVTDLDWRLAAVADFSGDGKADLLWRHRRTGANALWLMDGPSLKRADFALPVPDLHWRVAGSADLDGDGRADLLWHNEATGANAVWLMEGLALKAYASLPVTADLDWRVAGLGDLDGDGRADILWRHALTGQNAVWLMGGLDLKSATLITAVPDLGWQAIGVTDLDGDGRADLLWHNEATGANAVWLMNGAKMAASGALPTVTDSSWEVAGVGDYNGDGRSDLLWRNRTTGANAVWLLDGLSLQQADLIEPAPDLSWRTAGELLAGH